MANDPTYITKNYEKQGGDDWHVGGTLTIDTGGKVVPDSGAQAGAITAIVTTATTQTTPFGFATQAQGDNLVAAVNSIITALHNLGILG